MSDNNNNNYMPPDQNQNPSDNNNNNNQVTVTNTTPTNPQGQVLLSNLQKSLKTNASHIFCPICENQAMTRVEKSCSWVSGCGCIFGGGLLWLCVQCVRGKDINCYDANHFCSKCGNTIANYKSC